MTPKVLELYKVLQPIFPKDWRAGDWCYDEQTQSLGVYVGEYSRQGRTSYTIAYAHCLVYADDMSRYLHVPLPIDPVNPERGLWGMVDWSRLWPVISCAGELGIRRVDKEMGVCNLSPPTLALLKALRVQEGK